MVADGMVVGLGTGSTAAFALEALGRRIRDEGLQIIGTTTSYAAERLAKRLGIPCRDLDALDHVDIALDGADEIDDRLNLIKGRGGAHTREKVVASVARRFVALGDWTKRVELLGSRMPVPVEVLPMALAPVVRALRALGGDPQLRIATRKDGPVVSDQGFWILDVQFPVISDPEELNIEINQIPGVLDHGLFVGMATDALIGMRDGSVEHLKRAAV